ncbi:MAG: DUF1648 domain-containing protein [Ruminococcaceae bacterium]|nr:DUF1648 domain-containing protein [Oscillospiraceae bacterium]
MFKKHLKTLIISSLITVLPIFIGFILWPMLPEMLPVHWGPVGADSFLNKTAAILFLPLVLLALQWIMALITVKLERESKQNEKVIKVSLYIVPALSVFVSGITFLFGLDFNIAPLIPAIISIPLGLLMIVLGNILPKAEQNKYFGIKMPSTFSSEKNWNATHRFGGKVWVICGILLLLCCLVPMKYVFYPLFAILIAAITLPIIYSLNFKKKHPEDTATKVNFSKKETKIVLIILAVVLIVTFTFVGILTFTGSVSTTFNETSFTVDASLCSPLTVNYDDIEKVEFLENSTAGNRLYGVGSAKILAGTFKNEEFGKYTRYSYTGQTSVVAITSTDNNILVITGKNADETKALYNKLLEVLNEGN